MKYQINRFKLLHFYFLMILLMSCQPSLKHLEEALAIAGNNRMELEKVLQHYQQNERDSLKLKAAIFLIENMPGHKSLGGPYIDKYYKEMDSILSDRSIPDRLKQIQNISLKYDSLLITEEDINVISADYLISNIDSAFNVWQKKSWAKHVEFSDFCEYILPYKAAEYQPMENWREKFSGRFTNIPDSAWRYWRYLSPDVGLCNISELAFFKKDSIQPTKGKIIGTEGSCYCDPNHLKETVFDGDPLTFFDAPTWSGAWVGMDFGEKVKLGEIIYILRTDGIMKDVKEDVINYLLMCYI